MPIISKRAGRNETPWNAIKPDGAPKEETAEMIAFVVVGIAGRFCCYAGRENPILLWSALTLLELVEFDRKEVAAWFVPFKHRHSKLGAVQL